MQKVLPAVLFLFFACAACGTHTTQTAGGSDSSAVKTEPLSQHFYKRYSGTVAGKPVVVHFIRFGDALNGTYQYPGLSRIIALSTDSSAGNYYRLTEQSPERGSGDPDSSARWVVTLDAAGITGQWQDIGRVHTEAISLKEEYPAGSTRLDAYLREDSLGLIAGRKEPFARASVSMLGAKATDAAAAFINSQLRDEMQLSGGGDMDAEMSAMLKKYLDGYRKDNLPLFKEGTDSDSYWFFNFTQDDGLKVMYNDKGLLVLQHYHSDYTGGAHGNYGSSFLNLDVANNKAWSLGDVVADTTALAPMLNFAARNYFSIPKATALDEVMMVSDVPVTSNFYVAPEGITFVYNPYEIASYADGIVELYLPYKKLITLLTPAFRARMHLGSSAGMALHSRAGTARRRVI